jgi:ferredoxin
MVCPTCFCYDTWDRAELDLSVIERIRRWDSCQDERFAEVHGGNFRSTREARLRQFVCHKLSYWVEQYGCFGCVGCGRCVTWCPTGIDLTEIAAEIRADEERK